LHFKLTFWSHVYKNLTPIEMGLKNHLKRQNNHIQCPKQHMHWMGILNMREDEAGGMGMGMGTGEGVTWRRENGKWRQENLNY
jgi:hypothetical protein